MKICKKCLLFCLLFLLLLPGCGAKSEESAGNEAGAVSISMILRVNPNTGIKDQEELVAAFNETFAGVYEMDVTWIMETEEEERQNMKQLNVTDSLPSVLESLKLLPSFYKRMVEDGRLEEISSYIYADEEWMAMIEPAVLADVTEEDGSIYLAPISTAAFSCSGIFWNEELFLQAGIESFPQTWEEFWDCCDRLLAAGITPLALHTEGTAWAPMLLATAEVSTSVDGLAFMQTLYPETYNCAAGEELAKTLMKLFSYTTEDALYVDFDVAYTNFFSGEAAMIPNGYWMIEQIPEDYVDKVRFASFPENTLISSSDSYGWAIVSTDSQEELEAALAFLKFRTAYNLEEKEVLFSAEADTKALADYLAAYEAMEQLVPNYQTKWNSIFQEETLGETLPLLVSGELSTEEFLEAADASIKAFEAE